jgi:holo-[acyl-carrier protein] synthase
VAAAARARGIVRWHLSISHDAGAAIAFVIGEGDGVDGGAAG